jgi:hypothetical protein
MAKLFVCDNGGRFTVDIDVCGPVMAAALEHDKAEALIQCAIFMALSVLVEGESWPTALFQSMTGFMSSMRNEVCSQQLM